ncbi:MAG: ATP-binding protein [Gammaproteobacteria bacterium]|nr:ATP-binding protein [Gammaproteobacteria bacterium]
MSLRNKVIFIIVALFLTYGALDIGVQRFVIMPSFTELERDEATKNMERAVQAMEREIEHLGFSVSDWAFWDDTYEFVSGTNPEYVEDNLVFTSFTALKVHLMHFYNTEGKLVWGKSFDLETEEEIEVSEFAEGALTVESALITHKTEDSVVSGVFMTQGGPMLLVSKPVLTNEIKGPPAGAIIMARFLNEAAIDTIAEQARVDLVVAPLMGANAIKHDALQHISDEAPTYIEQTDTSSRVFTTFKGVDGKPALLLQVDVPREISARGETAVRYAVGSLAIAGLLALGVLLLLLQRTVFKPVTRLTNHVIQFGKSDDLAARIAMERDDEIGTLAQEFDRMVERLADARRRLIEQSYESGVAEMASGVLHNIGNALTPVTVRLANLSQTLHKAPLAEVDQAHAELAEGAAPAERQAALKEFVTMAGQELAETVRRTAQDVEVTTSQISHIEQILADQEKFSRAERVLEAIDIDGLVAESLGFVSTTLLESMSVKQDSALKDMHPIDGARTPLQQVVANLIINAAEAIQHMPADEGRLEISAEETRVDGDEMLHIRFKDNGCGIDPQNIERIFERGFTTKPSGASGLGLHWSANTVSVMRGRLYAESEGAGRGACLHLLLPLSSSATGTSVTEVAA